MTLIGQSNTYRVGDKVLLNAYTRSPIEITHLHSGHYDFTFTGKDPAGKIYYFDELDIYDVDRQNS